MHLAFASCKSVQQLVSVRKHEQNSFMNTNMIFDLLARGCISPVSNKYTDHTSEYASYYSVKRQQFILFAVQA